MANWNSLEISKKLLDSLRFQAYIVSVGTIGTESKRPGDLKMSNIKTTAKQNAMILAIGQSQYGDGPGDSIWTMDVCNSPSDKAVLGSLYKKGLADGVGGFSGDDATCRLTAAGIETFNVLQQAEWVAKFTASKPVVFYLPGSIKTHGFVVRMTTVEKDGGFEPTVVIEHLDENSRRVETQADPREVYLANFVAVPSTVALYDELVSKGLGRLVEESAEMVAPVATPSFTLKHSPSPQRLLF